MIALSHSGSPPLTRELLSLRYSIYILSRITPAYAGTTIALSIPDSFTSDHPRLRGNYSQNKSKYSTHIGSPPLTRELLEVFGPIVAALGITPAYAGTTLAAIVGGVIT